MTEVKGSMIHLFYNGSYNIYNTARADYINGSIYGIEFLNFELTRLVLLLVAEQDELRPPKDPRNISAVKAESEP